MIHYHAAEMAKPFLGFLGAMLAGVTHELAQATPSIPEWFEQGAAVSLIACLAYAVITLWKTIQSLARENKADRDAFHDEIARGMKARLEEEREERAHQRAALERLSSVLEKMNNHKDE